MTEILGLAVSEDQRDARGPHWVSPIVTWLASPGAKHVTGRVFEAGGGILGIAMMRLVIGQLLAIVERFPLLVDGAFVIIAWVGTKLLIEYGHAAGYLTFEIPKFISLGVIVVIFAAALAIAMIKERTTKVVRHK